MPYIRNTGLKGLPILGQTGSKGLPIFYDLWSKGLPIILQKNLLTTSEQVCSIFDS
jgi:hypothetical protein